MLRLTVADVFSIRGRGTVATGRIETGTLRVGDQVVVNGRSVRVDGIESFRKLLDTAGPGDQVGLLFKALTKDDVSSGDVITTDGFTGTSTAELPDIGLT